MLKISENDGAEEFGLVAPATGKTSSSLEIL